MEQYSTKLTNKQWQFIEKIVNTQKRRRKFLASSANTNLYIKDDL